MNLKYEVLHENVYHFPCPFEDIQKLVKTLEEVNSEAVTPWGTWYANGTEDSHPYGDLKVLQWARLELETDPSTKEKAKYCLDTLVGTMEACCKIFMEGHGANEEDIDNLHKDLYESQQVFGIRRYNENEDMGPHQDRVEEDSDTYTISVYLDEDYEGGELGIVQPGVDVLIKPKAGTIVVFPSGYLHESKPLISGRKTIITHVHTSRKMINF